MNYTPIEDSLREGVQRVLPMSQTTAIILLVVVGLISLAIIWKNRKKLKRKI